MMACILNVLKFVFILLFCLSVECRITQINAGYRYYAFLQHTALKCSSNFDAYSEIDCAGMCISGQFGACRVFAFQHMPETLKFVCLICNENEASESEALHVSTDAADIHIEFPQDALPIELSIPLKDREHLTQEMPLGITKETSFESQRAISGLSTPPDNTDGGNSASYGSTTDKPEQPTVSGVPKILQHTQLQYFAMENVKVVIQTNGEYIHKIPHLTLYTLSRSVFKKYFYSGLGGGGLYGSKHIFTTAACITIIMIIIIINIILI